ncbi:protein disulfide-isomerase 2-like [Styela clava]
MFRVFVLLQLMLLTAVIAAKDKPVDPVNLTHVFELNDEELNHTMRNFDFLVVNYYTASSKGSMEFQQTFMEVAKKTFKENKSIVFGQIDINRFEKAQFMEHITEVPEVKFYKRGRSFDFDGQKTVEHLMTWIRLAMNYPVVVSSQKEFDDLKERGTIIAGCFYGNAPKPEFDTFVNVSAQFFPAKYMPLPRFALINKASVSRDIGINKGTVAIYKKFENGEKFMYTGSLTDANAMLKFVDEQSQPIVYPFGQHEYSYRLVHSDEIRYQHLLFMPRSDARFKQAFDNFKAAAKEFMKSSNKIEVLFIHVDTSEEHIDKVVSFFHVDIKKDIPCNRITKRDSWHSRFIPSKMDFTKEGFIDFTRNVIGGTIKRNIRSEILPGNWNKFPLKVLVGTNYEEITKQKGMIVFVMYYVKGHKESDKAMPVIDEVAQMYKLNNTVTIASMDVSKNDGEIDVHHTIPCFKMFTATNQEKAFKGTKSAAAIKEFIDSNGTIHTGYMPEKDDMSMDFEFDETDVKDPDVLNYESEEERQKMYALDEEKAVANAIEEIEGHKAHDDPKHMVNPEHYRRLARGEVVDERDMDPHKDAHYATSDHESKKHGHEEQHIFHEGPDGTAHHEVLQSPHKDPIKMESPGTHKDNHYYHHDDHHDDHHDQRDHHHDET